MSTPQLSSHARADFHLLAKPTGAVCNLGCKYRFFLSKEMLYPGSWFRLEVYRFFRDELKTEFIQFLPIIERVTPQMLPIANLGWGERGSDPRPLYLRKAPSVVGRRAGLDVHLLRDLRQRAGPRAQRRPLLVRSLRGAGAQAGAGSSSTPTTSVGWAHAMNTPYQ